MAKSICFFNHKGGVSKTTTAFNVGWAIANQGKKVLLVDLDPQCNLTGVVLGYESLDDDGLEILYKNRELMTMKPIVESLINGRDPNEFIQNDAGKLNQTINKNLFLLPGHLDVADLDSQISVALKIAYGVPATRNIPGNLPKIIDLIADENEIDYLLFDLSPNVGGLNEVILMSSDYFIVPASPDFFCWQAVSSLAINIEKWHNELARFKGENSDNSSKSIKNSPKFVGVIQQRYRPRYGAPAKSFEKWINRINAEVNNTLVPELQKIDCIISNQKISDILSKCPENLEPYNIAYIPDFNSLIAMSQNLSVPVFSLTDEQIKAQGQFGHAFNTMKINRDHFKELFTNLADRVISLTS